jgi:hypothetical protein
MLLVYEVLAFVAGIVVSSVLWSEPARLLRGAALAAGAIILILLALGLTGWPLLRERLHNQSLSPTSHGILEQIHFVGGHLSLSLIGFATPLFFGAALQRQRAGRKVAHLLVALFVPLAWVLITVSGYVLPPHISRPIPPELAPKALRFVVIHALIVPCITGLALAAILWRNIRLARRVAAKT